METRDERKNPFLKTCPVCEGKSRFDYDEDDCVPCQPCHNFGKVVDELKFWFTQWTQEQHVRSNQAVASVKDPASDEAWLGMQYDMDSSWSNVYLIHVMDKRTVYTLEQVTELLGFLGHTSRPSCSCQHDCCGCVSSSIRLMSHDGRYWLFREDFSMNI